MDLETNIYLYTDASVNPIEKKGIGAFYIADNLDYDHDMIHHIKSQIHSIKINTGHCTFAEQTTIEHVFKYLDQLPEKPDNVYLFTDCKSFVDLPKRKDTIKKTHPHYELYMNLIHAVEKYKVNIIWTKGHSSQEEKTENYEHIFSLVDKHARHTLQNLISQNQMEL